MKKAFCVAALLFALVGLVRAADPLDFQGKPEGYKAGETQRYAVWHDEDGWHLRTTTAKNMHQFHGKIVVKGGKCDDVKLVKGEKSDHFRVGPEKHVIEFDFKTDEAEDGIDFRTTKDSDTITWELKIDGEEKPGHVFVGHKAAHPHEMPFTTPAHPVAEARKGKK